MCRCLGCGAHDKPFGESGLRTSAWQILSKVKYLLAHAVSRFHTVLLKVILKQKQCFLQFSV